MAEVQLHQSFSVLLGRVPEFKLPPAASAIETPAAPAVRPAGTSDVPGTTSSHPLRVHSSFSLAGCLPCEALSAAGASASPTYRFEKDGWVGEVTLRQDYATWDFRIDAVLAQTACVRFRLWEGSGQILVERLVALSLRRRRAGDAQESRQGSVTLPRPNLSGLDSMDFSLEIVGAENIQPEEAQRLRELVGEFGDDRDVSDRLSELLSKIPSAAAQRPQEGSPT
jgi:hypothetical protein